MDDIKLKKGVVKIDNSLTILDDIRKNNRLIKIILSIAVLSILLNGYSLYLNFSKIIAAITIVILIWGLIAAYLLYINSNDVRVYFDEIKKVKRESRIARDNSEDALTWNVMRFLDRQGFLTYFLSQLSNKEIKEVELILWSYSPKENSDWSLLNDARKEFGETVARGSEPDIIIRTDKVLYFLEAKLTAKK